MLASPRRTTHLRQIMCPRNEVAFVKYVLHALYGQICAFPILSQS